MKLVLGLTAALAFLAVQTAVIPAMAQGGSAAETGSNATDTKGAGMSKGGGKMKGGKMKSKKKM